MTIYQIAFSDDVHDHLDFIKKKYYSFIEKTLVEQLGWEPDIETKNRKVLEQPAPFNTE